MVSDFQRPMMRMTSPSMPPSNIAMAPLARRERVETSAGVRPTVRPSRRTLLRMALVRSALLSVCQEAPSW